MDFSQLFSILAAIGALLFFLAGFSLAQLKNARTRQYAEKMEAEETKARDSARETASAEIAREGAARQALDAECARLRLEVKASSAEIARLQSALVEVERRAGNVQSALPPAVVDATSGVLTFQGILGRLSKTKGMRAAVLGDGLGLPIAALGEQSESLAGFCGFISQAASKARDFLQLGSIRRIVIEDERLATLTACSVGGTDLFLATLTSGPGPEFARMVQVLNDVKSFMSQRSRA